MRTLWIRVDVPDDDEVAMGVDEIADGLHRLLHVLDHQASVEVLDELPDGASSGGDGG